MHKSVVAVEHLNVFPGLSLMCLDMLLLLGQMLEVYFRIVSIMHQATIIVCFDRRKRLRDCLMRLRRELLQLICQLISKLSRFTDYLMCESAYYFRRFLRNEVEAHLLAISWTENLDSLLVYVRESVAQFAHFV